MKEEKELLLKYLCASLPYDTIVNVDNGKYCEDMKLCPYHIAAFYVWEIKPYLRPLSSMTEKEKKEFDKLMNLVEERCINAYGKGGYTLSFIELNDWLNKNKFDYRGLIPMGLAIEAPEGMYK